jgi:peptide/nickel transport system ATP-binding protein
VASLSSVGLPADILTRYAHEFSGGQRQRIAIARAIVCHPRLLLADEPVSALDVTTRIQVIDLLSELRESAGLAILMVSHDLSAVAGLCDQTVVLKAGRVVEYGPTTNILSAPRESYTRKLVEAAPRLPHPE